MAFLHSLSTDMLMEAVTLYLILSFLNSALRKTRKKKKTEEKENAVHLYNNVQNMQSVQ